jgi:hypothetical protein
MRFEWVDKKTGKRIRLSAQDAARLINEATGRGVTVSRSYWKWLAAALGILLIFVCVTFWQTKVETTVADNGDVMLRYRVQLFSWQSPVLETKTISRSYVFDNSTGADTDRNGPRFVVTPSRGKKPRLQDESLFSYDKDDSVIAEDN